MRLKARLSAVLSAVLLLSLLAAPAAGDTARSDTDRRVELLAAARGDGASSSRTASPMAVSDNCFADAAGDTRQLSNDSARADNRADIVEHCGGYGGSLALTVEVAQPTDPETDPNWRGGTFLGWFLDTDGDGNGEYFVEYALDADLRLRARVNDLSVDPAAVACEAVPSAEGGLYGVSGINAECIGSPDDVSISPGIFYDTAGGGNEADIVYDVSPEDGAFDGPLAQSNVPRATGRLAGAGRIETSVEISQAQFPNTAATVYLARADMFADAVAGGVLTDGPILLVPSCNAVPEAVSDEITRLDPQRVVALGGNAAICQEVLDAAAAGRQQGRVAGIGRVQTAVEISRRAFPNGAAEVYLARADVFADAVAAGVLTEGPILLVPSCGALPEIVRAEINRLDPQRVVALGGTSAVCEPILAQAGFGRTTDRIAGGNRIETSVEISQYEFETATATVYLARADQFADAVAGGALTGGPILLVPSCGELPAVVAAEITRLNPQRVVALGGRAAICDEILAEASMA